MYAIDGALYFYTFVILLETLVCVADVVDVESYGS